MFEWNSRYTVGIASIDAQHQELFRIAGELHSAMMTGQGKTASSKILHRLAQYTATHFAYEERLLRLSDYPNLAAHKVEHEALTQKVRQFESDFQKGAAALNIGLLQFLKNWLQHHIEGSDRRYASHLQAHGVG